MVGRGTITTITFFFFFFLEQTKKKKTFFFLNGEKKYFLVVYSFYRDCVFYLIRRLYFQAGFLQGLHCITFDGDHVSRDLPKNFQLGMQTRVLHLNTIHRGSPLNCFSVISIMIQMCLVNKSKCGPFSVITGLIDVDH